MKFFDNIILNKQTLGNEQLIGQKNSLHIAFGIDANFTMGTGVLIYSILQHNNDNFIFHIFTDSIYENDISRFNQLCDNYSNICIIIYHVNPNNFKHLPTEYIWTQATYYRILACEYLPSSANKVLYIDSDILCLNSLKNLFNHSFNNKIALVTGDIKKENYILRSLHLNLKGSFYFSAGFMLINIPEWKKLNISKKFLDLLNTHRDFQYLDQDALNILLKNNTVKIDDYYHKICPLASLNTHYASNTIFVHFAGSTKPWQTWAKFHPLTKIWLSYKNKSPWYNVPLTPPQTYKQAKFMAKNLRRNHKIIASIKWYIKYSLWKIKTKI